VWRKQESRFAAGGLVVDLSAVAHKPSEAPGIGCGSSRRLFLAGVGVFTGRLSTPVLIGGKQ